MKRNELVIKFPWANSPIILSYYRAFSQAQWQQMHDHEMPALLELRVLSDQAIKKLLKEICFALKDKPAKASETIQKMIANQRAQVDAHQQLLQSVNRVIDRDGAQFKPFTDELELGIEDSFHYNRALRRLCTSSAQKVSLIVMAIFSHRFILNISVNDQNKDGLTALDYARINNPHTYALMLDLIKDEYKSLSAETAKNLFTKFFSTGTTSFDHFFSLFSGANSVQLSSFQEEKRDRQTAILEEALEEIFNTKLSADAEIANQQVRGLTNSIVTSLWV